MAGALRVAALTAGALVGFAANSLLCRAALRDGAVDAASFTAIRLASGAAVLAAIVRLARAAASADRVSTGAAGTWASAFALTAYAIAFSLAYLRIGAGAGALILFGAVQLTMIGGGLARGERPTALQWPGIAVAIGGLVVIVAPRLDAPPAGAAALMAGAGVAWGVYSLRGRNVTRPLAATAGNFVRSVPFAAVIAVVGLAVGPHVSASGAALAAASGAIASGLGYSLWYGAVPSLGATRAAVVQLAVPVLAAGGAIALLGERLTSTLAIGAAAIVGGLALSLAARRRP